MTYTFNNITSIRGIGTINQPTQPNFEVNGKFIFNGQDLTDLVKRLEAVEKRLAILTPDPQKLAQFESLRRLHEQYRIVEALYESQEGNN
jgi:hypothetical protein